MSPDTHVLLTVRGTLIPADLESARVLHNDTAGSAAGIAAARELGDLSHKVYAPCLRSPTSAPRGELLFVDAWVSPEGIGRFFSNGHVQQQAAGMFSKRDATIWMKARGAWSWALQAPAGRNERYVGVIRGPVASPEAAIAAFADADRGAHRDARRRGMISHDLFVKLPMPGDDGPVEILGLDVWCDLQGMTEHYGDSTHMAPLGRAFSGKPDPTAWEQAAGTWSEW